MSSTNTVTPQSGSTRSVLSEELEQVLEFTAKENDKHRDFFERLYKLTAGSLTVIFVCVGAIVAFFGWRTVGDIRKQAQDATAQEVAESKKTFEKVMSEQTATLQKQLNERINAEFETQAIRGTITNAARQQTQTAMMPLITKEVRSQVSSGVKAEQTVIRTALTEETKKSVDSLKPTIDIAVEKRVNSAVDTAVRTQVNAQITPQLQELQNSSKLYSLITRAQGGDGVSFDQLILMAANSGVDQDAREIADKVSAAILQSYNSTIYTSLHYKGQVSLETKLAGLKSLNSLTRRASIDELTADYAKSHIRQLREEMLFDNDLGVRQAAYVKFKTVTGAEFLNLDSQSANMWWTEHSEAFIKANPQINTWP